MEVLLHAHGYVCYNNDTIIDSVIGATLEYSGYNAKLGKVINIKPNIKNKDVVKVKGTGIDLIGNDTVNFIANFLTSIVGGWMLMTIYSVL